MIVAVLASESLFFLSNPNDHLRTGGEIGESNNLYYVNSLSGVSVITLYKVVILDQKPPDMVCLETGLISSFSTGCAFFIHVLDHKKHDPIKTLGIPVHLFPFLDSPADPR